ncbi:MAG: hypothetical protein SGILL_007232, partial [Bacillariaceae sp.]
LDVSDDDGSLDSGESGGSLDDVDADKLLLGLAARDEIWRKQVLDALDNAIQETDCFEQNMNGDDDGKGDGDKSQHQEEPTINDALSEQLGSFLFGKMAKIVKQEKESVALPPNEITRGSMSSKKKGIRELVEDQQIDSETKSET